MRFASLILFGSVWLLTACNSLPGNGNANSSLYAAGDLMISPQSLDMRYGAQATLSISGGYPPYSIAFSANGSGGTIPANQINSTAWTFVYISGTKTGLDTITITDSMNSTPVYANIYVSASGQPQNNIPTVNNGTTINDCHTSTGMAIGNIIVFCGSSLETARNYGSNCSDSSSPDAQLLSNGVQMTCGGSSAQATQDILCCEQRTAGQGYSRTTSAESTTSGAVAIYCGPNESASFSSGSCTTGIGGSSQAVNLNGGQQLGYEYTCGSGQASLSITCTGTVE